MIGQILRAVRDGMLIVALCYVAAFLWVFHEIGLPGVGRAVAIAAKAYHAEMLR